jgi:hypothetical protein
MLMLACSAWWQHSTVCIAELSGSISFVQYLLATLVVAFESDMGAKSSKQGTDSEKRSEKLLRKRRFSSGKGSSGSDGIATNVQDSPFGGRGVRHRLLRPQHAMKPRRLMHTGTQYKDQRLQPRRAA